MSFGTSRTILIAAAIALAAPVGAAAQDDEWAVGSWKGTLVAGPQQLEIIYHIVRGEDGALSGTMDVPSQGARGPTGFPLSSIEIADGVLTVTFPVPGGGSYEGTLNEAGDGMTGTFTQGGQPFPMDVERTEADQLLRPQMPEPPFPYAIEDVSVPNAEADIELSGTITLPEGDGPFPGVVLVSGSGPQDRDETLMGHKPFWVIADHFTRNGIAVLRYDDRGVGESGGDGASANSEDLATDALSAVRRLAEHAAVSADRVGIVGHSEGGVIGPMVASESEEVAFVVMLAGSGVTGLEILKEQGRLINEAAGVPPQVSDMNMRVQDTLAAIARSESDPTAAAELMREGMRAIVGQLVGDDVVEQAVRQMNSPWFRFFIDYDPRPALEATSVPVLSLIGGKDLQVPPDQNDGEIAAALERGGNADATTMVLPGLNHLFQEADTGSPTEYVNIEQTISPEVLELMTSWILERFGSE